MALQTIDLDALFAELETIVTRSATWATHRLISEMHHVKARYSTEIHDHDMVKDESSDGVQVVGGLQPAETDSSPVEPETEAPHETEQCSNTQKLEHDSGHEAKPRGRRTKAT